MRNGWYPRQRLGNSNVPNGVAVAGSLVTMSGEVIETFYSTCYQFRKVTDWKGSAPQIIKADEIVKHEVEHFKRTGER